jgi:hypothetical protein
MTGFGVFEDFALSKSNQTKTSSSESTDVLSLKKIICQALSQPNMGNGFN